jgi:beta-lactamase superfamily II metal-dependent hydrolase
MAGTEAFIDSDLAAVFEMVPDPKTGKPKKKRLTTLFWGDSVRVTGKRDGFHVLDFTTREYDATKKHYVWRKHEALMSAKVKFRDTSVLKVRFVDVGQGDGAIIESPKGQIVVLDGGEEDNFYNYFTAAWAHKLRTNPVELAAIVVSHGDADHYSGLSRLVLGRGPKGGPPVATKRVYHNGLAKRPESAKQQMLGKTAKVDGTTYVVGLEDDLLSVADKDLNKPFQEWKSALQLLKKGTTGFKMRRLEYGTAKAFDFLDDEDIKVDVLGPITEEVKGKPALPMLRNPDGGSLSISHTINGHSVVLRLTYGHVRMLFGADLNEESEQRMLARTRADGISLTSEVLKVPHHGSADFSPAVLDAIRPVVSVVSSGDESGQKEYIHPRAGLVGALGKYSRGTVERPLVYVTEMVAFFQRLGRASVHGFSKTGEELPKGQRVANAYSKSSFGIVHIRTDGERVLVATPSGKFDKKEAYVFRVSKNGEITFDEIPKVL